MMQVKMQGISKAFGPVRVLEGVDFHIEAGEIHALMGENGAGKSTLMKILSGVYQADAGAVLIDGQAVQIRSTVDAERAGIAIIHQELNLIPQLTVMENLFLGREPSRFGMVDTAAMRKQARTWLDMVGAQRIDPQTEAGTLSIGQQQLVEIAKALSLNAQVLIMDEPTAALTNREIDTLFEIMQQLKARGVAIVYVSHRMEEIFRICDKISVLRDGHFVGERAIPDTNFDEIVRLMVGRELGERFPKRNHTPGDVRMQVENLADDGHIEGVSFEVRAGEVLGIAGLMGAGRSEILRTLFGANRKRAGTVKLDGKPLDVRDASSAIAAGIGFVTEDRKRQGLVLGMSVRENATLVHLDRYAKLGFVNDKAERSAVDGLIKQLRVRTRDAELDVKSLSGGNQQKVVFAKWLAKPPKVLLLDEPTRGVDVGGKAEIYTIVNQLAEQGVAIVMVSSELPEVLAMSDRILVMHQGRQAGIFEAASATQEQIMTAAAGGHAAQHDAPQAAA
ncbi:ribose transport system ATP-binding protein [Paraburkholderia tropica]|uniref:sugar ABC transporter ATP-binding protein n=1 Tax=Paraburkholderia tropica TaxID=92647 RepID=UPI001807A5BB|nr:sugar ABC transporter ATP-binding protein [Paraburkholderia tropica]MBB3000263.1 ribose transport system ATP-binding protein [Paraburkholderia tropica]MBB6319894.1 ribose transport system ATP-binding protein [Paraburkholderia tropica]